jgi:hypothetical protein
MAKWFGGLVMTELYGEFEAHQWLLFPHPLFSFFSILSFFPLPI